MTDDPPQGLPGQRALGAMESAVRRARAAGQDATPPAGLAPPRPPRPAAVPRWAAPTRPPTRQATDRWLMASVVVLAALVLAGGIALAYSLGGGTRPTATGSSTVPTTAHARAARHPSSGHARSTGGSVSSSTTTTTTTTPVVPGAAPVISALSPSTGAPGQAVQIAGSNFLSPDGRIVATFNGQVTSTSCPQPNTCMVTVPPSSGAPSAQVTITTASGTSNALTFRYS